MKKRVLQILICTTILSMISGCSKSDNKKITPDTETRSDTEISSTENVGTIPDTAKDDIILISDYSNYAEGYQERGWFIDGNGNVYDYDFTDGYMPEYYSQNEGYEFKEKLRLIKEKAKPTGTCDISAISKIYTEGISIDPDAEYLNEFAANDAGQNCLYFHDSENDELVLISASGDTDITPTDKHAKSASQYVNNLSIESTGNEPVTFLTSDNYYIINSHCGYINGAEGCFILFNSDEIDEFKNLTGIDIYGLFSDIEYADFEDDSEYGQYVYFVQISNTNTMGYNLVYDGLMKQGNIYQFTEGTEYSIPDDDAEVGEALDGFCTVAAVYTYNDTPQDNEYLHTNSEPWQRIEASPHNQDLTEETSQETNQENDNSETGLSFPASAAGEYYFSSGAGGWGTTLTVYEDGTFNASFHDSDMGASGEGYDGTTYIGNCYGQFTVTEKQSDYIYKMSVDITGHSTLDEEYIETYTYDDGTEYRQRYVYSDVYGLDEGTTFMLYLDGAPTSELPEGFIMWMAMPRGWGDNIPETLSFNGIYNVEGDCGFGQ
ncbi:MAG: hypothetical protein IJV15_08855 [Lachnospiraceae bacterium]|nr:hypothetical protein [Lachnospiraceae bacterium]